MACPILGISIPNILNAIFFLFEADEFCADGFDLGGLSHSTKGPYIKEI
ncbi:hypothetical protein J2T20_003028 [Paenibacillus wynnii]|nr:hypothetical protein [Paenibacillus wynnii]